MRKPARLAATLACGISAVTLTGGLLLAGDARPLPWTSSLADGHSVPAASPLAAIDPPPSAVVTRFPVDGRFLIGAGDICVGYAIKNARATANLIDSQPTAQVFTLGDGSNEEGTESQYSRCYADTWGRLLYRTRAVVGNHDLKTAAGAPYYNFFGAAAGPVGLGYYSYDLADNWHVIVLNSECAAVGGCGAGSPEETFLRNDLAAHSGRHLIAMWHRPLFSSGEAGDNANFVSWWNDLYAAHAEIVLNGHDHDYERFSQQSPYGLASPDGIREFVVGTGGANLRSFHVLKPNSEKRIAGKFGVLFLTLNTHSYSWRFIPVVGHLALDSGLQSTHN
jgi:acid phosphatase type 7